MSDYKIYRWDAVILNNETQPKPMVYIKPKGDELDCMIDTIIEVKIGENTFDGFVKSSKNFPNYRPDFFSQTGYYVVVLNTYWNGYPREGGVVTLNLPGKWNNKQDNLQTTETKPQDVKEQYQSDDYKKEFVLILVFFFFILTVLYLRKGLVQ
jgi:hypothetical protein